MGTTDLEPWPRPHYQAGGGEPMLFYVVFGATTRDLKLSRSRYRCEGVPAGIGVFAYEHDTQPDVLDDFRSGYLWDELQCGDPALAAQIAAQPRCVVIRGELADAPTLDYFRDTLGLVTCLLDNEGVAVYDPQSLKWWSADAWRETVFAPGTPSPGEHVVILASGQPDGATWFHTRGLRKFGRPDLSIHDVTPDHQDAVVELFRRFIDLQAYGGIIPEGQEIRMRALPPGLRCAHGGSKDDPDFNNVHVEVCWPREDAARP